MLRSDITRSKQKQGYYGFRLNFNQTLSKGRNESFVVFLVSALYQIAERNWKNDAGGAMKKHDAHGNH